MREYIYRQNIGSVDGSVVGSVVGQSWVKRGSHARSNHEEDVATTRNFVSIPLASVNEAVAFTVFICRSVLICAQTAHSESSRDSGTDGHDARMHKLVALSASHLEAS